VIYKLSKFQLAILRQAASGDTCVFAVLTPNEEIDSPEAFKRLRHEEILLLDFVKIGIADDVSAQFTDGIAKCKIDTKRSYKVLALNTAGILMFDYCDDATCNSHPKGDPRKRLPC
jgi:hypothetical protein